MCCGKGVSEIGRVTNKRQVELEIHSPKGNTLLTLPGVTGNRDWIALIPRIELNTISNDNKTSLKWFLMIFFYIHRLQEPNLK